MSSISTCPTVFAGSEFSGSDELNLADVSDWVVDVMGGEAAK